MNPHGIPAGGVSPFGGTLGAVAGALTGLLFVAVSVRGRALSESPALRNRAAQTLVLFMTSVLIAVVVTAPQPSTAVGWQLLALAALSGSTLFVLDRRAGMPVSLAWLATSSGSPATRSPRY